MGFSKWLLALLAAALALAAGIYAKEAKNATFESLNRMAIGAVSESEIARAVFHIHTEREGEAVLVSAVPASKGDDDDDDDDVFDIIRYGWERE